MNEQSACVAIAKTSVAPLESQPTVNEEAVGKVMERFGLPRRAVHDLVSLSIEALRDRDRHLVWSNMMEPSEFPRHELGTAKIDAYICDPMECYTEYLDEFDAKDLVTSETEDGIRKHRTYARYVEMALEGHEPPPIHVFASEKIGVLVSTNRRRTLVAQQLGRRIKGWHGRHNFETGLPLKYGDVKRAYIEALNQAS
ncbi:hypothetical protein [Burkholderia sp. Ac-20365]|uniref:hypothetical protein n=1 Tax=Burkholderia sp. Ac-20365 TaxID=2703897 RepID=UPI00197C1279|nr:hypothetical protein [Burkholderia sp. Ac-20365]MBN3760867.1 hypothetical protein [Burkholderia sp. Ac-20365]